MENVTCGGDSQQQEVEVGITDDQKASSTNKIENEDNLLNAVECLRMKNSLMEILEELKLRRINDKENEERIKKADKEKYDLNRKCEAETLKLNEAKEQFQKQLQDAERKYNEKLSQTEEQLKQQKAIKDCTEKEINGLKDEIRNLEVVKYTLEKDLKEQERKLQLHVQSSEQHLNQLTQTERSFKALQAQCRQLGEEQDKLKDSVQHALRNNQSLLYINDHQRCTLIEEKKHVSSLQSQLLEVKSQLQKKPDETSLQQYQQEIASLKRTVERLRAEKESSLREFSECAAKYEKAFQLLQDTYRLLEHQLEVTELYKRYGAKQKALLHQQVRELAEAKSDFVEVQEVGRLLKEKLKGKTEEWQKKTSELQDELSKVKEDLAQQKKRCVDLEDLNTTWSNQNIQLTEQLQFTKEQLNKPRQDQILQTELCLMNMVDMESQVGVISTDLSVQTMSVPTKTNSTQTLAPELTVSMTQTNNPALANSSSQTERLETQGVSVQAEIIKYNSKERLFCQALSSSKRFCKPVNRQSSVEIQSVCSQSNARSSSDSQTLQSSLSASNSELKSQLSDVTSQPVQTKLDRLQNPNSQHTSEFNDQEKTGAGNQGAIAKSEGLRKDQENGIYRGQVEQQNVARRQSFQLPESTTSDEDKSVDKEIAVSRGIVVDETSLMNDKGMTTETINHHVEMETTNSTSVLLQNQEIQTETCEAEVQINMHPVSSLSTSTDMDHVTSDGSEISRQNTMCDLATDSAVPVDDPDKTCVSPRSPGGSRLKLSLSRPKTMSSTPPKRPKMEDATGSEPWKATVKQTPLTLEQLDRLLNSLPDASESDDTDAEVKGILKGQGKVSTRKQVTFGSPLQDVRQLSQSSVESVSNDDGDKELFSDDSDTEDELSKAGIHVSDKSLPATTLIIGGKRVESSNTLACRVDDFLPDTSLSKTKTINENFDDAEDLDLEIASKINTFRNSGQTERISDATVSEPSLTGRDTVNVDLSSGEKADAFGLKRKFPALEIPSAQQMMVSSSTLSNQYKRTIDAILNKGKKLKTEK